MIYRTVTHVAGKEMNFGDPSLTYYADGAKVKDEEAKKPLHFCMQVKS